MSGDDPRRASANRSRRPVVAVMDRDTLGMGDLATRLPALAAVVVEPSAGDLADVDAAIVWPDAHLTRELLAAAPRLTVVTHLGTALHVDVEAATEGGVVVLHNPGQNAISVAEHTIGLLLALAKGIARSDRNVRTRQHWRVGADELYGTEIAGKTIGLLGFGAIGQIVASIVSTGFGMRVLVFDRSPDVARAAGYDVDGLDEVLSTADVVSVHLPLTAETFHLLDRDRLSQMKPSALLVHTARGEVVDHDALHDALRTGRIAGAAFDTWPGHRANPDSPLIDLDNVVMTQHNAGLTRESAQRMADAVMTGIAEVLAGERPSISRIVNAEVWDRRRRFAPG